MARFMLPMFAKSFIFLDQTKLDFRKSRKKIFILHKNRRKSRNIVCFYIKAFVYFTHCIFHLYNKTCFTITFTVEHTKCTSFATVYKILKHKLCEGKHISYRVSKQKKQPSQPSFLPQYYLNCCQNI